MPHGQSKGDGYHDGETVNRDSAIDRHGRNQVGEAQAQCGHGYRPLRPMEDESGLPSSAGSSPVPGHETIRSGADRDQPDERRAQGQHTEPQTEQLQAGRGGAKKGVSGPHESRISA